MKEIISSAQNPKVRTLLELQTKSRLRREIGIFVLEGRREIEHCVCSGYELESLFFCPEILGDSLDSETAGDGFFSVLKKTGALPQRCFEVSRQIYDKLAYRGGTEGVVAEVKSRNLSLGDIPARESPLLVVLESVEKPGNLGAVLRSADAAGADAVIVCDPLTDIYNPNVIRSSIGAVFTVPVVACTSEEAVAFLKAGGYAILTAQLQDSSCYYDADMTGPTALVMGTESTGLTDIWRKAATSHILIPMLGKLDSLNVSVSASILMFEAVRQRMSLNKSHE